MSEVYLTGAAFHMSTRSSASGDCVEVGDNLPHGVAVRDTKDRDGTTLTFAPAAWASFVAGVKSGEFDLR